jgi:NAD(P)-dependent dehydrogenase (short-subunit alcohol dehydrogenase family)
MKPAAQQEAEKALAFFESLTNDPKLMLDIDFETRKRLNEVATHYLYPDARTRRGMSKARRKRDKKRIFDADQKVLEAAQIRTARKAAVFATPRPELEAGLPLQAPPEAERVLHEERSCYVCKTKYRTVHHFYDQMCASCGDFNFKKRTQSADLKGRTVLITGARVKIGYQAGILLLRSGARVLVSTRFPKDAALRYSREPDFEQWKDRLVVHGLDLRHTPSVEAFCAQLIATEPRLDHIIHNACQTVRRPSGFYTHLMEGERAPLNALPENARGLVAPSAAMVHRPASIAGLTHSAELSQAALLDEDHLRGGQIFPAGQLDQDLQQKDYRGINSWRLDLANVPTVELLEVQLVNAIAPFVMNARLKPLMMRTPERDKHIVNVSAMEGQFYRTFKTDKHPHTNMAKAALNMMTRTSAADYVQAGIHMNSVDTGWVTDEDPAHIAERKTMETGFQPPLDIVDGAARIVDPIFHGANTGEHMYGLFLKDYRPIPW